MQPSRPDRPARQHAGVPAITGLVVLGGLMGSLLVGCSSGSSSAGGGPSTGATSSPGRTTPSRQHHSTRATRRPTSSSPTSPAVASTSPTKGGRSTAGGGISVGLAAHVGGQITGLAADSAAVYVEWRVPSGGSPTWRVSRYDVGQGRVTATSAAITKAGAIATAGGAVWVGAGVKGSGSGGALLKLDGDTMQGLGKTPLRAAPTGVAITPAGTWVGDGGRLQLVDPRTNRVTRTVSVTGAIGQLVSDPVSTVLYDAVHRPGQQTALAIEERDGASGQLIFRSGAVKNFLAINGLAVVPDNVWVAYPTGMQGATLRFTRAGLHERQPAGGSVDASNAIEVYATSNNLWIDTGGGGFACADPVSGQQLDRYVAHGSALGGPIVESGTGVYRGVGRQLLLVYPGGHC
jgi:hypothetical protein